MSSSPPVWPASSARASRRLADQKPSNEINRSINLSDNPILFFICVDDVMTHQIMTSVFCKRLGKLPSQLLQCMTGRLRVSVTGLFPRFPVESLPTSFLPSDGRTGQMCTAEFPIPFGFFGQVGWVRRDEAGRTPFVYLLGDPRGTQTTPKPLLFTFTARSLHLSPH